MTVVARRTALAAAVAAALIAAALIAAAAPAGAQALSGRPVTIVVPFTAGTGMDILARVVAEQLRQRWGQTVVVENKPGASGNIGTQAAAQAAPDGHTLMMTANTFVMTPSLLKSTPYDPVRSFAPVALVATGELALAVHPSLAAPTAQAFFDLARQKPGAINYASPGIGTPQHLAMELVKLRAKIDLTHVPYRGSAPAVTDLAGGHVGAMILPVHTALPLAQAGSIRVLAVTSPQRAAALPDVPTMAEAGVPNAEVDLWYGLFAPAGTPADIVRRYNGAVNEMLEAPAVKDALRAQGLVAVGGPPQRLADLVATDQKRWAQVVADAKIPTE